MHAPASSAVWMPGMDVPTAQYGVFADTQLRVPTHAAAWGAPNGHPHAAHSLGTDVPPSKAAEAALHARLEARLQQQQQHLHQQENVVPSALYGAHRASHLQRQRGGADDAPAAKSLHHHLPLPQQQHRRAAAAADVTARYCGPNAAASHGLPPMPAQMRAAPPPNATSHCAPPHAPAAGAPARLPLGSQLADKLAKLQAAGAHAHLPAQHRQRTSLDGGGAAATGSEGRSVLYGAFRYAYQQLTKRSAAAAPADGSAPSSVPGSAAHPTAAATAAGGYRAPPAPVRRGVPALAAPFELPASLSAPRPAAAAAAAAAFRGHEAEAMEVEQGGGASSALAPFGAAAAEDGNASVRRRLLCAQVSVYTDATTPHALAVANALLASSILPDGVQYIAVQPGSFLFNLSAQWQFPAYTVALGSSYFQRLLKALPMLQAAVQALPSFASYHEHTPCKCGAQWGAGASAHAPTCAARRAGAGGSAGGGGGCGAVAGAASLEATLRTIQFSCVFLACKMVDQVHGLGLLRFMLGALTGAPSSFTAQQAEDVERRCLVGLRWRLGPWFAQDELLDDDCSQMCRAMGM